MKRSASPNRSVLQRIAIFTTITIVCVVAYLVLYSIFTHGRQSQIVPLAAIAPACLTIALLTLSLIFIRGEGWPPGVLGFNRPAHRIVQFFLAFLLGSVLVLAWVLIIAMCMGFRWHIAHQFNVTGAVSLVLFTFALNAAEELAYRGYAFLRISESCGPILSITITSALFTLFHIQSGVPWLNAISGVLTCALIYAVLFARWRSIPLVLGFHLANNLAQELFGLRQGPLTLLLPESRARPHGGAWALVLIAALNAGAAVFLYRRIPRHVASNPAEAHR